MEPHNGVEYQSFLSALCRKRHVKRYLELGVQSGFNLAQIPVDLAVGVDPEFDLQVDVTRKKVSTHLYRLTSDEYFSLHAAEMRSQGGFDFTFIDGMHLFEYLLRDFYNAEASSSQFGLIAMHDCLPFDGDMIRRDYSIPNPNPGPYQTFWTGDVWKIVPILQKYRADLRVYLVDCWPTGVVVVGNLDPASRVLQKQYYEIVDEYASFPNDRGALEEFYQIHKLTSAKDILNAYDHTIYFNV